MSKIKITKLSWYQKLIRAQHFPELLLLVVIIPSFLFFLKPGIYWNMHDDMQLVRQLEMEKCFYDGQLPCRWVPDLGYGYGYPLFNFYPPMPYFVGQLFRFTGFSFVASIKLTAALQIILSAYAMYLLASSIFGKRGGFLASLFYTYAPYHAVNVYIRGAMNEAWAAVFFPLIFYFSKKVIEEKKLRSLLFLSLSFSGLLLSHNPMVLIFTPALIIWCLFWLIHFNSFKLSRFLIPISRLFLSAILSLCLSAFFTLPVVFETKLVQIESMFSNYYFYALHFVSFRQIFINNFWGDGPSLWGPLDGLPFAIGHLYWLAPLCIGILIFINFTKKKLLSYYDFLAILLSLLGLFTLFMTHERSTFLWKIFYPIQKIQFPWRFLNIATFLMSLSIAILPYLLRRIRFHKTVANVLICCLTFFLITTNVKHFYPLTSGPVTDSQKFAGQAWINQVTGGIYDYLPKTAKTAPKSSASNYIDQIFPSNTKYVLTGEKKGTDWQFFNLELNQNANISLPILAFPRFTISDNGSPIEYKIEPSLGRINIDLQSGQHQIYIKLHNTNIRNVSNIISILSWVILALLFSYPLWKKLILKH